MLSSKTTFTAGNEEFTIDIPGCGVQKFTLSLFHINMAVSLISKFDFIKTLFKQLSLNWTFS